MLKKNIYLGVLRKSEDELDKVCVPLLKKDDDIYVNLLMVNSFVDYLKVYKFLLVGGNYDFVFSTKYKNDSGLYIDENTLMNFYQNFSISDDVTLIGFYNDYFSYNSGNYYNQRKKIK